MEIGNKKNREYKQNQQLILYKEKGGDLKMIIRQKDAKDEIQKK